MNWEIVIGIITLVGFMSSTGAIIAKLSGTLSKLQVTIQALNDILSELKESNNEDHKTFFRQIGELQKVQAEHDVTINMLCGKH